MSDAEKLVEAGVKYPDDPLILRPHVGGDVLRSRSARRPCWPRSFILRFMLICVLLATIAGCILIIFTLHHSGAWPWSHFHRRYASAAGSCRVFTPLPEIGMEERYLYEPNAITITHGPVAGFPSIATFHLLKEAMSVMRTHGVCYVYPLDPEIAEAVPVDESIIQRIKENEEPAMVQVKSPLGMRVFMIAPDSNGNIEIKHPAAAANCSDVPIFRLIEMVLSQVGGQFDPFQSSEATDLPQIPCPKECTWGESRVKPLRQVCRCPPRDTPPKISLPQFPEQSESGDSNESNVAGIEFYNPLPFQFEDKQFEVNDNQEAAATADSKTPAELLPEDIKKDETDVSDVSDDDDDEEEEDVDDNIPENIKVNLDVPWYRDDEETLSRRQRSIDTLHSMEGPMQIPATCVQIDEVLEAAVPNSRQHTLSKMTILKC